MSRIGKKLIEIPQAVKIEIYPVKSAEGGVSPQTGVSASQKTLASHRAKQFDRVNGQVIKVSGPKGELKMNIHRNIKVENKDGKIFVLPNKELSKKEKGLWGLHRALIFNMVEGVCKDFEKKLEIDGIGYKAIVQGNELVLSVGFVHPVKIKKPEGINFSVEKNVITISGINKESVGQIAAEIRAAKKAEPYKGKGIKYQGEKIRRKEGKKVVASK